MQHAPVIQQDAPGLVVVGAGCAGVEAAFAARNAGWQGPITLLGEESAEPYHRPPLSKAFLQGTAGIDSLGLKQAALYERAAIARIGATRVTRIDRAARRLHCADGRTLPYGKLVLACGGARAASTRRWPRAAGTSITCARSTMRAACARGSNTAGAWSSWAPATSGWKWRARAVRWGWP